MEKRLVRYAQNGGLVFGALAVVFAASILADKVAGVLAPKQKPPGTIDFLHPPFSEEYFEYTEFTFDVRINNLGVRDRDFPVERSEKYRIIALGDSFTYGWGVAVEESWTKQLEKNLRAAGYDVEVINMGTPGTGSAFYANLAERAVPILKPDLVLIGMLHNDLGFSDRRPIVSTWRRLLEAVQERYPNLTRIAHKLVRKDPQPEEAAIIRPREMRSREMNRVESANAAKAGFERLPQELWTRFDALEESIKEAYFGGRLNAFMVLAGVACPYFYTSILELPENGFRVIVDRVHGHLARIERVARKNGAQVVATIVPSGAYTNKHQNKNLLRLGFETTEEMLTADMPDRITQTACAETNIPCISVTPEFRESADDDGLYFPLDNHLSARGHKLFADLVAPKLVDIAGGNMPLK